MEGESKNVSVYDMVGQYCVSLADGQLVYDTIYPLLADGHYVNVDFDSATIVTTCFLNNAIGQLLHDFDRDTLNRLLKFTGLTPDIEYNIRIVIENAKKYYRKHNGNQNQRNPHPERRSCPPFP